MFLLRLWIIRMEWTITFHANFFHFLISVFIRYLVILPFESSCIKTSGAGHCSLASCKIPGWTFASCDGGLTKMDAFIEIKK
jgi:hypothetical protein